MNDPVAQPRWDTQAIRAGATVSLMFAVPLAALSRWAANRDDTVMALWASAGALCGFIIGSGVAAWLQRLDMPFSHGLVTATGTYAAAASVFIMIELVTGDDVAWFGALFNLTVTMGAGLIGGVLGWRLRARGVMPSTERSSQ